MLIIKFEFYEYKGIAGFVYRETNFNRGRKIVHFQIKEILSKLVGKNYLVLINSIRLIILEAKMYGERLDIPDLPCEN